MPHWVLVLPWESHVCTLMYSIARHPRHVGPDRLTVRSAFLVFFFVSSGPLPRRTLYIVYADFTGAPRPTPRARAASLVALSAPLAELQFSIGLARKLRHCSLQSLGRRKNVRSIVLEAVLAGPPEKNEIRLTYCVHYCLFVIGQGIHTRVRSESRNLFAVGI